MKSKNSNPSSNYRPHRPHPPPHIKECQNINTVKQSQAIHVLHKFFTIEVFLTSSDQCINQSIIIITHPRSQLLNPFPYPRDPRINTLLILLIRSQRSPPPATNLPRRRHPRPRRKNLSRPRNIHLSNFRRITIILGRRNNPIQRPLSSCLANLCPTVHFVVRRRSFPGRSSGSYDWSGCRWMIQMVVFWCGFRDVGVGFWVGFCGGGGGGGWLWREPDFGG